MDSIAGRLMSFESVKVETRQLHIIKACCSIQRVQPAQDAGMEPRINLRLSRFPKSFELLVGEGLYRLRM